MLGFRYDAKLEMIGSQMPPNMEANEDAFMQAKVEATATRKQTRSCQEETCLTKAQITT